MQNLTAFDGDDPVLVMSTAFSGSFVLGILFTFLMNVPDLAFFFLGSGAVYLAGRAGYREYKIRKLARELGTL